MSSAAMVVIISSGMLAGDTGVEPYLERSVPYVGAQTPRLDGADGSGILIAVIDTGVDYEHPDMHGWLGEGKVAGGENLLLGGDTPLDRDGHGTQVAGVAVADGGLQGVAPKSKILAYKVSDDGNNVSSELIAQAILRAAEDGADIINISMGVAGKNSVIEDAINSVLDRGVPVVVAAGNAGPESSTIGSPGRSSGSLTVGATYNNLTSSMVATLDVGESASYTVIPMVGTGAIDEPIEALLVPAGYAKESDFDGLDVRGAIVVAERGSDIEDDLLYFSLKEKHAADAGASALVVYNNEDGFFIGELIHEFIEPGYEPRIPVVSMERQEGLELLEHIQNSTSGAEGRMHLFHNPDFVAHFSSRGPASPFYIKPDLVAPGAYINTTQVGSIYEIMSGTSYAAPHVSGMAALLLQKNPGLEWPELKSIIMTTADPVTDSYGERISVHEAGSGRLNASKAYEAQIAILPPSFVATVSDDRRVAEARLEVRPVGAGVVATPGVGIPGENAVVGAETALPGHIPNAGGARSVLGELAVEFEGPEFLQIVHALDASDGSVFVRISLEDYSHDIPAAGEDGIMKDGADAGNGTAPAYGEHEGRVVMTYGGAEYTVPFVVHYTRGSVQAHAATSDAQTSDSSERRRLAFDISHPDGWEFAKIDVIDSAYEETVTVTATPETADATYLDVYRDGTYWVDARIQVQGRSYHAYDFVHVGPWGGTGNGEDGSGAATATATTNIISGGSSAGFAPHPGGSEPDWATEDAGHGQGRSHAFAPQESLPARQVALAAALAAVVGVAGALFWMRGRARAGKTSAQEPALPI